MPTEPVVRQYPERESNPQTPGFKPSRSAGWRIWVEVVPDGVEPPSLGCRPSIFAVGPRDRRCVQWTHRESHPDLQLAELASSCWTMSPDQVLRTKDKGRTREVRSPLDSLFRPSYFSLRPSRRHAPKDLNPDQLGWSQSCCQLHQGRVSCRRSAEAVGLEPTSGLCRRLFSRQVPHPAG